jgi:hypothetical protein
MAVGIVPDGLVNITAVVSWTPTESEYTITLLNGAGQVTGEYAATNGEPFGYEPSVMDLDMSLFLGLRPFHPRTARLAQSLAGFSYFEWFYPAAMSSKAREMYAEAAK